MSLPWISGVIVLFRKDGKTLFNDYRNFPHKIHEGKYSPPGGKVDEGETSVDSGVRESWEEVRISVTKEDLRFVGRVHFDNERRRC